LRVVVLACRRNGAFLYGAACRFDVGGDVAADEVEREPRRRVVSRSRPQPQIVQDTIFLVEWWRYAGQVLRVRRRLGSKRIDDTGSAV